MPTPAARLGDRRGAPSQRLAAERMASGRRNLDDAVGALLPTPMSRNSRGVDPRSDRGTGLDLQTVASLLPTPRATDGTKGGPNQRGSSGDLMLPSAVVQILPTPTSSDGDRSSSTYARRNPTLVGALLPTPVVKDKDGARNATANRSPGKTSSGGTTLSDVAYAEQWGKYAAAIAQWETILGRPAPDPTEPARNGSRRLSARFVEWMMGLPAGWVTDVTLSRNAHLRILGGGVVPQQGVRAFRHMLAARHSQLRRRNDPVR